MNGLTLYDAAGTPFRGEELAKGQNVDNGISIAGNLGFMLGALVVVRAAALVALKLAYRLNWL